MKLRKPPPSGEENYHFLLDIWNHENMCTFKDFLRWYNNKDVVPTLEVMQKKLVFFHKKGIDILKLGCTLPNLLKFCLHKSTSANFHPFTETDKDLLQNIREDMAGGPSIVFTRKAVVHETFKRNSGNICRSIVGIDASHLYPYSKCQPMPTGLYTRWEIDIEFNRYKPQQNKSRSFEKMVMSYLQRQRPDCKIESFHTTGTQKRNDCFKVDGFCSHCNTVFETIGCLSLLSMSGSTTFSNRRRYRTRQQKERNGPDERAVHQRKKDTMLLKCGNVNGGISTRRQRLLKNIRENHFLTNVHWKTRDCWNK